MHRAAEVLHFSAFHYIEDTQMKIMLLLFPQATDLPHSTATESRLGRAPVLGGRD